MPPSPSPGFGGTGTLDHIKWRRSSSGLGRRHRRRSTTDLASGSWRLVPHVATSDESHPKRQIAPRLAPVRR